MSYAAGRWDGLRTRGLHLSAKVGMGSAAAGLGVGVVVDASTPSVAGATVSERAINTWAVQLAIRILLRVEVDVRRRVFCAWTSAIAGVLLSGSLEYCPPC